MAERQRTLDFTTSSLLTTDDSPFGVVVMQRTDIPTAQTVEAAGYPRCPTCGSYEVTRHVDFYRVWFTCSRCGAVFGQ